MPIPKHTLTLRIPFDNYEKLKSKTPNITEYINNLIARDLNKKPAIRRVTWQDPNHPDYGKQKGGVNEE